MTTATLSGFAKLIKVSRSYITTLRRNGRLVMAGRRVDVDASRKRIKETESGAPQHTAARQHWENERNAPDAPAPEAGNGEQLIPNTRAYWDRRAAAATAEMREIELAKMKGDLIPREDVDFVLRISAPSGADCWKTCPTASPRRSIRSPPSRKPTPSSSRRRELQTEMAATMKRRIEEMGK